MQPDLPTMAGPGKARANAVSAAPAALASDKVLLAVADSDKIEAHPYVYAWKPEERERDLAALQSLAADAIRRAAKDRASLRGIDPTKLTEVETYALDPDSTNRPIEILAATVAGAASKTWLPPGSVMKAPPQVRLMLVARKNSEGKLNQIFSMISDPLALDVRPSAALPRRGGRRRQRTRPTALPTAGGYEFLQLRALPRHTVRSHQDLRDRPGGAVRTSVSRFTFHVSRCCA